MIGGELRDEVNEEGKTELRKDGLISDIVFKQLLKLNDKSFVITLIKVNLKRVEQKVHEVFMLMIQTQLVEK